MGKTGQILPQKFTWRTRLLAGLLLLELGIFPYSFQNPKKSTDLAMPILDSNRVTKLDSITYFPNSIPTVTYSLLPPTLPTAIPSPKHTNPKIQLAQAKVHIPKVEPVETAPLIEKYGAKYNVDPLLLHQIASCESGYNSGAVNGPYAGMYQFLASTWMSNRKVMGENPDPSLRYNAEESIKTAAFKISRDGAGAWPVCSRKYAS